MSGAFIIGAIELGCVYAIIGVGFVIIYRSSRVLSFAQGFYSMLGALVFAHFLRASLPYPLAILLAAAVSALVGGATYVLVLRTSALSEPLVVSLASVGVGLCLEAVGMMIWGPQTISMPSILSFHRIGPGWAPFTSITLATLVCTVVTFGFLTLVIRFTRTGLQMRAAASGPGLASRVGLSLSWLGTLSWALAGGTAGVAGCVYLLTVNPTPGDVFSLGFVAFPALLLGGLDSIPGCVLGALIVGFVQTAATTYLGGAWYDVSAYLVLLVVLLARPSGIFGSPELTRP